MDLTLLWVDFIEIGLSLMYEKVGSLKMSIDVKYSWSEANIET